MLGAARSVVVTFVFTTARPHGRQIAYGAAQHNVRDRSWRRIELGTKIAWLIRSHAHDQLTPSPLRDTKSPTIFNLSMHSVPGMTSNAPQFAGFLLHGGKILTASCSSKP
jgi:hypothetical protein